MNLTNQVIIQTRDFDEPEGNEGCKVIECRLSADSELMLILL